MQPTALQPPHAPARTQDAPPESKSNDAEDQTIELPDDATGLTVKQWVAEYNGVAPEQLRVIATVGNKILKDTDRLNSNPNFLNLKVIHLVH